MGAVLYKIFKIVESEGGVAARLKFAKTTKVSLERVKKIKDKPEYIRKFCQLAASILETDIDEFIAAHSISAGKPAPKPVKKKKSQKDKTSKEDDDILL